MSLPYYGIAEKKALLPLSKEGEKRKMNFFFLFVARKKLPAGTYKNTPKNSSMLVVFFLAFGLISARRRKRYMIHDTYIRVISKEDFWSGVDSLEGKAEPKDNNVSNQRVI